MFMNVSGENEITPSSFVAKPSNNNSNRKITTNPRICGRGVNINNDDDNDDNQNNNNGHSAATTTKCFA